ncbi:hypothetical protein D3C76_1130890 [compost metagenome]
MPSAARSASAKTLTWGKTWVNPGSAELNGVPYCATSLPANRIAATTVICCPNTARIANSKPSHAPGTRSPGRSAISRASSGSTARCRCIVDRSASRSNIRRTRATIAGTAPGSGKSRVNSRASALAGWIENVPQTPFKPMLREYTPSTTVSSPVIARADKNPSIAGQS